MMFYKETNFKETSFGKIPKDWNFNKLGDVANIFSGNTAPQEEVYFEDGKYPFIRVQHLTELEEQKYPIKYDLINDLAISELKLKKFKKGSIIFPKSGESIRLEKRAILKEDSYIVNHLAVIEPINENINNLFLFYYLCTIRTSDYLTKTTMPSLNLSTIRTFLVPLPSLQEQQKIAEILSTIDEAIQKTNEIIAKTERLKKGLMQELLTKGIGHKEFKDTEIGKVPKDWEVVRLGNKEVCFQVTDGFHKSPKEDPNGIPLIKTENIHDGKIDFANAERISIRDHEKEKSRCYPRYGDVLLTCVGTLGRTAVVETSEEFNIVRSVALLKPGPKLNSYFLHYVLNSIQSKRQMEALQTSTTRKGLYLEKIRKIKIPLPPLAEQQIIAEILSTTDKKLELERNEKAKLERIKQGLMDLLLTGKIRIKVN